MASQLEIICWKLEHFMVKDASENATNDVNTL